MVAIRKNAAEARIGDIVFFDTRGNGSIETLGFGVGIIRSLQDGRGYFEIEYLMPHRMSANMKIVKLKIVPKQCTRHPAGPYYQITDKEYTSSGRIHRSCIDIYFDKSALVNVGTAEEPKWAFYVYQAEYHYFAKWVQPSWISTKSTGFLSFDG